MLELHGRMGKDLFLSQCGKVHGQRSLWHLQIVAINPRVRDTNIEQKEAWM